MRSSLLVCLLVQLCILTAIGADRAAAVALELHVSPQGSDTAPGTADRPFQTLERARDVLRTLKATGPLPAAGIEIVIHPGTYRVAQSFLLTQEDSGTSNAPIVYRAAGPSAPRFTGGGTLRNFTLVEDPATLARLPEAARGKAWQADLAQAGLTNSLPFVLGGFSSGRGFRTHPAMELFVNGEPMTLARWPNEGFVMTGEVPGPLTLPAWDRKPGSPEGRFRFDGDRPARWIGEPDAWLYGYWFWDWADSYEKIQSIDLEKREITLAKPWHTYGYRKDQRYHAINLLSELDAPGEWYLDRAQGRLFLFAKSDPRSAVVELSAAPFPLMELRNASHLRFEGLLWECGAADGLRLENSENCQLLGCTVQKMAGNGIDVRGGRRIEIRSCDIHTLGRGGIALVGGNRKTLTPSEHRVENCHIHHLSRIDHTYTPGIWMDGVGHQIRNNLIHHVASSAMRVEGNEHLVELNEVHRVVLESDDQGAVDMFGNPTYRGNVYRYNYWHHLGNWQKSGEVSHTQRAGIRLDDAICGTRIHGNVFQRCSTGQSHFGGVQIHGGKENLVESNLFVDTAAAVSFTPWGDKRWREFVAKSLDAPAIDRALYLQRYPALASLPEGHDRNAIRSNVALRCDKLFLRAPSGTESVGNREVTDASLLPEGPDGRLVWSLADAEKLGLADIPFEKIGLYEDAWRRRAKTSWILRGPRP
jgi:hypothetical protein